MAKRLPSPTDEDAIRIAEALNRLDVENKIQDGKSFTEAYEDYFEGEGQIIRNRGLRNKVFNEMQDIKPELEGRPQEVPRKRRQQFPFPKKTKGRVVFTRRSTFKLKGKTVTRFRDKLGRFTSN